MQHYLREGLPPDGVERVNRTIEEAGRVPHPWLASAVVQEVQGAPPVGWKSDEENWRGIQGFLGQMGTVKGAVSREKVK